MPCPTSGRFTAEMFNTAMSNFDLWEALYCPFAAPLGALVVGTVLYSGVALNIFIRTGSFIIPFVLVLLLGGTVLAQMLGIISTFAGLIILIVPPLIVSGLIFFMDMRT